MSDYTFNLETAIATWRQLLYRNRAFLTDDINELENHLRDHIDDMMRQGADAETAFRTALTQLGNFADLEPEYQKVRFGHQKRLRTIQREVNWSVAMLKNYVLSGARNIKRHPGYTFINLFGFALGIACSILIGLYVHQELSYDNWHEKGDRIYRVTRQLTSEDGIHFSARSAVPVGPTLALEFPEIEKSVRFWRSFQSTLGGPRETFRESGLYFTDPNVFDVFSLELLTGDTQTALSEPGSMVLTESAAERYFGDTDPIGRILDYRGYPGNDSLQFMVTGVLRDLPENTHLAFTALATLVGIDTEAGNFGSSKPIWTYVLLPENVDPEILEKKFAGFVDRHFDFETTALTMHLEPLMDIHLSSRYLGGFKPNSSMTYPSLFSLIGLFILILACVNFVNLSTVRTSTRAREVGIRKVFGAVRRQLVAQFMGEAILLVFVASAIAVGFVAISIGEINSKFETALSLDGTTAAAWIILAALILGVGGLTGLYPTLVLSSMKPVTALKKRLTAGGSPLLRKGLVVFQFTVSVSLIACTMVVYNQLDYFQKKDLGFDKELIVVMPRTINENAVRTAFERYPDVIRVSVSQRVPVSRLASDGRPVTPEGFDMPISVDSYIVDDNFLDTFGLQLLAGRNLSEERPSDESAFIINETAVNRFGWGTPEAALGRQLAWHSETGPVVGVVKDFHIDSMHARITPLVLQLKPGFQWWRTFISAKIRAENVANTRVFLENTWREHNPGGAYEAFFLDDSFEQLHRADARIGRIFSGFAGIAVLIACLGLFGLAAYTAEQRVKEIGVRKVMGASMGQIIILLSKDFVILVGVAVIIAIPIVAYSMNAWLSSFAYRIELGPGIYLSSAIVTLVIALSTVSYQAIRASRFNPVKCLRHE